MEEKELPVYELSIDDNDAFVNFIALVENPAIEENFLAFSKQSKYEFAIDEEKHELLGAAIIPDKLIYRVDNKGNEFNVFFSANTIRNIAQAFFQNGYQSNLNIEHGDTSADSYVFQSMIVDKTKGISFKDYPDGSWIIGTKVMNDEVWKDIKDGKRKGFSIEGVFAQLEQTFNNQEETEILNLLKEIQEAYSKLKTKHI